MSICQNLFDLWCSGLWVHFTFVAKDMRTRAEVVALGKAALKVTIGTWGWWREPKGKSSGPWPVWRSLLRAPLWHQTRKVGRLARKSQMSKDLWDHDAYAKLQLSEWNR